MDRFLIVVSILAFGVHVNAEEFIFQAAAYDFEETPGGDNKKELTISRTGSFSSSKTITITTECPTGVTATASSADFDLEGDSDDDGDTTVTFGPTDNSATLEITIENDDEEEFREFFCLTIKTDPGSQNATRIYIPGNDYCVHIDTPAGTDADNIGELREVKYVGPWLVGDTGYPDLIFIDIEPQSGGLGGDDINIFLTENVDQSLVTNAEDYFGIFLDDLDAGNFNAGQQGDSVLVKNGYAAGDFVGYLNDASESGVSDVVSISGNSFTLKYTESSGTVLLEDQSSNAQFTASSGSGDNVDVNHVFVSSGNLLHASWNVCGLLPRKLPTVGALASGYLGGRSPDKAIDGFRGPDFTAGGCFTSNSASNRWLKIDLGKEYDVKMIIIYPMFTDDGTSTIDGSSLDNADVYVGSCLPTTIDSLTSNNNCDLDIGSSFGTQTAIEVKCNTRSYGRYVFIHQDTSANTDPIRICEVEVYGDEIPYGETNEATVQFTAATFKTADDESAETVSITAKRTGDALTCTTADFYTATFSLPGGDNDDFTAVLSTAPWTFSWDADDDTTTENTKTMAITIEDDNDCEPTETFNVYLTNVNGGVLGDQSWATVTINDDDSVNYALSDSSFSVNEGDRVNIGVERTGPGIMQEGSADLTFTYGSAQSEDYTNAATTVEFEASSSSIQNYVLSTEEDQKYEGDETLTVSLGDLKPSTCSNVVAPQTAAVTIKDDDSQFEWDVADDSITIPEGTATTILAISREGVAQTKTINIDVDEDDADTSSDFALSSDSVTFAATRDSESITVSVVDDSVVEMDESFTLTLRDPLYTTGDKNLGDPYRVKVTIQDNDAEYSWVQDHYSVTEGEGSVRVCLRRQGDTSTTQNIRINSASGTATSGVDFKTLSQITFSGTSEACANVAITNDNDVESTKVFTLTIASGQQDVALGGTITTTVEITDDDYTVTWELPSYSFQESSTSSVNYVKIVKTGTGSPVVAIASAQGTARQGIDYTINPTSATLSGSEANIQVTIIDDEEYEQTESFILTLSGTGITSSSTSVTITDDDPAPTEPPPPEGLSGVVIAVIAVAVVIGVIVVIVAVVIFFVALRGASASSATAAAAAGGAAAAAKGIPLSNFNQFGELNSYGNGLFNGFESGLSNQGFGGFNQQQLYGIA